MSPVHKMRGSQSVQKILNLAAEPYLSSAIFLYLFKFLHTYHESYYVQNWDKGKPFTVKWITIVAVINIVYLLFSGCNIRLEWLKYSKSAFEFDSWLINIGAVTIRKIPVTTINYLTQFHRLHYRVGCL